MTAAASAKAVYVESQARIVTEGAKNAVLASQKQKEAFAIAKASVTDVTAAAEKAHASFRYAACFFYLCASNNRKSNNFDVIRTFGNEM